MIAKKRGFINVYVMVTSYLARTKFESGTGWPSFWAPIKEGNLIEQADNGMFMRRTEVLYNKCDAHLGHVFDDGPAPTNQLYQFCLSQTREEELRK
jgi:peptide methionine sulfoxide reductase MsrB